MSIQQEAYIGVDCLKDFYSILKRYNPKKIFLVRGKKSYQYCGAESVINNALSEYSPEIFSFSDFEENPKLEDVQKGLSHLEKFKADIIIAIGGGSVLDISKLIRFFYSYDGDPIGTKFEKKKDLLPLFALPTTAGTGCEATHFAVMYKDKIKYSVEHDHILPDYAFVYPPFTYNTPPYLTACAGFDALAQGIEAFWNINATEESDKYAIKAIELLWTNLPLAVNYPSYEVRNKVSEGAYWAGRAINITKTTAPHAFSYALTTYLKYPHGHAVALTFPFFVEVNTNPKHNTKFDKKKMTLLNHTITGLNNAIITFEKYLNNIGLITHLNIEEQIIRTLFSKVNLQRLKNNPVNINNSILNDLYIYVKKNNNIQSTNSH